MKKIGRTWRKKVTFAAYGYILKIGVKKKGKE